MNVCRAFYRKALLETIEVSLKGIRLTNQVEVPGSQEEYILEWDPQDCPPYTPDCDL